MLGAEREMFSQKMRVFAFSKHALSDEKEAAISFACRRERASFSRLRERAGCGSPVHCAPASYKCHGADVQANAMNTSGV